MFHKSLWFPIPTSETDYLDPVLTTLLRSPKLFPFVWEMETKNGREQQIRNDVGIAEGEASPRPSLLTPLLAAGSQLCPLGCKV